MAGGDKLFRTVLLTERLSGLSVPLTELGQASKVLEIFESFEINSKYHSFIRFYLVCLQVYIYI